MLFSHKNGGCCDYENREKEGDHHEMQNNGTFKLIGKIEQEFDQICKHEGRRGNNNHTIIMKRRERSNHIEYGKTKFFPLKDIDFQLG